MGRVSRDARLLFILMWTIADDSGRLRGNSRMLASLLFPYDVDAPNLIDDWIDELLAEKCIVCYRGDSDSNYVAITHWSDHQKIDKPSESKLPAPNSSNIRESSRSLANNLEASIPSRARADRDQGPRTGNGPGGDQEGNGGDFAVAKSPAKKQKFIPPTLEEVIAYGKEIASSVDPERFFNSYESQGWKKGNGRQMTNWRASFKNWSSDNGNHIGAAKQVKTFARQRLENSVHAMEDFINDA